MGSLLFCFSIPYLHLCALFVSHIPKLNIFHIIVRWLAMQLRSSRHINKAPRSSIVWIELSNQYYDSIDQCKYWHRLIFHLTEWHWLPPFYARNNLTIDQLIDFNSANVLKAHTHTLNTFVLLSVVYFFSFDKLRGKWDRVQIHNSKLINSHSNRPQCGLECGRWQFMIYYIDIH